MNMTRRDFLGASATVLASTAIGSPIRSSIGGRMEYHEGDTRLYDSEVEYLESTGTQWINTGVLVSDDVLIDCSFELLASGNVTIAGGRYATNRNSLGIWAYTNPSGRIRFDLEGSTDGGGGVSTVQTKLGKEYQVSKIGRRNFVDGVEVTSNNQVTNYTPKYPFYLFAMNTGGTASFIGHLRIKRFSISGLLNMLPVRFTNEDGVSEGAMYDCVSGLLFRNQGTGSFIIGPDI